MWLDAERWAQRCLHGAWMLEAASDARTYTTSQPSSWDSSKSDGDLARAGTGGVHGRPMDSRTARMGSVYGPLGFTLDRPNRLGAG